MASYRIAFTYDSVNGGYTYEVIDATVAITSSVLPSGAATSAKQLADGHNVAVSNMIPSVETGLATSAKQLADGHNVAVSNMIPAVETGLATSLNQTDASQKTQIVDASGNVMDAHASGDGGYHLGVNATLAGEQNAARFAFISPTGSLSINPQPRLVGTNFDGTTKDTNFWTEAVANGGLVTQDGEIELNTRTGASVVANGSAQYNSVRKARFVVGSALMFAGIFNFVTAGTVNNARQMGAYDDDEGFFFQLDGTTFSVVSRTGTSDTLVSSGSFNGAYGTTWTPTANTYYKFDIEWIPLGAIFYINGQILHKWQAGHLTAELTLPIRFENINSGGLTSEIIFDCLGVVIMRYGQLVTNPTYYHLAGDAATHLLKIGAGTLQRIVLNNTSGTSLTLYDGVTAGGDVIGVITSKVVGGWEYGLPFNDGLTMVTVGNGLDATIIYE